MKPPKASRKVAAKVSLEVIMRSRSLTIDTLVLMGHTRGLATRKVANLTFPEE